MNYLKVLNYDAGFPPSRCFMIPLTMRKVDSVDVLHSVTAALIDKGGDRVGLRFFYIQNKCIPHSAIACI